MAKARSGPSHDRLGSGLGLAGAAAFGPGRLPVRFCIEARPGYVGGSAGTWVSVAVPQDGRDHIAMTRQPQWYVGGEMVLVIDCADLERAAGFWCEVLGYRRMGSPVGQYMGLTPPDGVGIQLLLQRVDDSKTAK